MHSEHPRSNIDSIHTGGKRTHSRHYELKKNKSSHSNHPGKKKKRNSKHHGNLIHSRYSGNRKHNELG